MKRPYQEPKITSFTYFVSQGLSIVGGTWTDEEDKPSNDNDLNVRRFKVRISEPNNQNKAPNDNHSDVRRFEVRLSDSDKLVKATIELNNDAEVPKQTFKSATKEERKSRQTPVDQYADGCRRSKRLKKTTNT